MTSPAGLTMRKAHAVEEQLRRLTELLYDTRVSPQGLEEEVMPFMAEDITFKDPWQTATGKQSYRVGLGGFHAMFNFRFEFHQVSVNLLSDGNGGRALVDGVMQLKQFERLLTYPLRTILVYDFTFRPDGEPLIHFHEEMWSFGDMIEAVPHLGRWYAECFRRTFAKGFVWASKRALARHDQQAER